jgi:predicted nucleic acid-binding protein
VYALGLNGPERRARANTLIRAIPTSETCIPAQVLSELFNVLVRKGGWTALDAANALRQWMEAYATIPTTESVIVGALELTTRHQFTIWDALVLASTATAGCRLLLSEDMQHGFRWREVTIVNPFAHPQHQLLAALTGPS